MKRWGGRAAQAWTAAVLDRYGRVCHLNLEGCTTIATTGDHLKPRSTHPDLELDVTNGRPACLHCNTKRNAAPLPLVVVDDRAFFERRSPGGRDTCPSPPRDSDKNQSAASGAGRAR